MWVAFVFIVFLAYDVWLAMWFTDASTGVTRFGIGLGTVILAVNVVLLASYTWGCHVLRHVVGGGSTRCRSRRSAIGPTPASAR